MYSVRIENVKAGDSRFRSYYINGTQVVQDIRMNESGKYIVTWLTANGLHITAYSQDTNLILTDLAVI